MSVCKHQGFDNGRAISVPNIYLLLQTDGQNSILWESDRVTSGVTTCFDQAFMIALPISKLQMHVMPKMSLVAYLVFVYMFAGYVALELKL